MLLLKSLIYEDVVKPIEYCFIRTLLSPLFYYVVKLFSIKLLLSPLFYYDVARLLFYQNLAKLIVHIKILLLSSLFYPYLYKPIVLSKLIFLSIPC